MGTIDLNTFFNEKAATYMPQDYRLRNPYDCPAVMKAVIQDIIAQIQSIFAFELASPSNISMAQRLADALCERVEFRGTRLTKLVSIELFIDPADLSTLNFFLRPRSEDGRHLLRIINDDPDPLVKDLPKTIEPPKVQVRRIVEI